MPDDDTDTRSRLRRTAGEIGEAVAGTIESGKEAAKEAGSSATETAASAAKEAGKTVRVKSTETGKAVTVKGARTAKQAAAAARGEVSDRVAKRKERLEERRRIEREAREKGREKALRTYQKQESEAYQDLYEMRLGLGEPDRDRRPDRDGDGDPDGATLGPSAIEEVRTEAIATARDEALDDYREELVDEYVDDYRVQLGLEEPAAPATPDAERAPPEADPRLGPGMGAPEMGGREAGMAPEMGGAEAGVAPEMGGVGVGVGMFRVPREDEPDRDRRPIDPVGVGVFSIPPAAEGQAAMPAGTVDLDRVEPTYPEVADPAAGLDVPEEYRL